MSNKITIMAEKRSSFILAQEFRHMPFYISQYPPIFLRNGQKSGCMSDHLNQLECQPNLQFLSKFFPVNTPAVTQPNESKVMRACTSESNN